ncbi:hypothetical protein [Paenibacillus arenilitoris]|uniref:Uncharacterized protein n=1 Tax=Paenibacillus arenilitoris TaxID=2772299 RepID=A0A927H3L1_9BACL|nr:hypothetical protein [Paenibacillus arenilitoris]MBD2867451.1 hypothetical protein [Paenibacillus arenilitoris]
MRSKVTIQEIADAQSCYERWLGFGAALQAHKIAQKQIPELLDHDLNDYYVSYTSMRSRG